MERTDENVVWAIGLLMKRLGWQRGFPTRDEHLQFRGESFLKLVYNLPVGECWRLNRKKAGDSPLDEATILEYGSKMGIDPNTTTDVEWLLAHFAESSEDFPAPVTLRRFYQQHIRPWDGMQVPDVPEGA